MKTKICHITTVHTPFDTRIFYKECKSLKNAGYEVSLIVQHDNNEVVDDIKIIPLPKPKTRLQRMLFLSFKACNIAFKGKADIYHFHDPELLLAGLILKFLRKKVIYDIHEDVPRQILSKPYLNTFTAKIISSLFEKFENFSAKYFDVLITATEFIKDRFIKIHPNTVDIKNYPLLEELYAPVNWGEKGNHIAYIGGITKIRGIVELVKTLEYVDTILHLAGNFENKDLESYVKTLPGWSKVVYYGFVNREKVKEIFRLVKVGIVTFLPEPNHLDSCPNKLYEYMSAGIPVVASNFPLWKSIVEDNHCGVCVDPADPEQIACAIHYLLDNPEEALEMGNNGRKAVMQKYNWENEGKKLLDIYKKL